MVLRVIIGIIILSGAGIGFFVIFDYNNVDEIEVEKGFFDVRPEQDRIQTMLGEKVEIKFILSPQLGFKSDVKFVINTPLIGINVDYDKATYYVDKENNSPAIVTFDPIEKSSVGQHNVTVVAKSQNTVRTFNIILDVIGKDEVQVDIVNYNFEPSGLTIVQGTKVIWHNKDDVIHSITSPENIFDLDIQRQEYQSFVFDEVGTFQYFCRPHPYMTGTITVILR